MSPVTLVRVATPAQWSAARRLIEEYAATLDIDLSFQDFAHELDTLEQQYGPPGGAMLLALDGDEALGCVGLRALDASTGEVKRLYVVPRGRGRNVGRELANAVIEAGRELGYRRLRLDTLPTMAAARALYSSLGFCAIPSYRYNPVPGTVFMELRL